MAEITSSFAAQLKSKVEALSPLTCLLAGVDLANDCGGHLFKSTAGATADNVPNHLLPGKSFKTSGRTLKAAEPSVIPPTISKAGLGQSKLLVSLGQIQNSFDKLKNKQTLKYQNETLHFSFSG